MKLSNEAKQELEVALQRAGLRLTRQREQVYASIRYNTDHPTADDVYTLVKQELTTISLATIYNCLETLVECGLVREVNFGRHPTRYEPAIHQHAHFLCRDCGKVFDIKLSEPFIEELRNLLPKGFEAEQVQLRFVGINSCEDEVDCEIKVEDSGLTKKALA